jgi:hypothetical protein
LVVSSRYISDVIKSKLALKPRKHTSRPPFSLVRCRLREIERLMRLRFPIPLAQLKSYLVPYAQHIAALLREQGKKQPTQSEIAERIEIKAQVLGIACYMGDQQLDAEISDAVARALKHPRLDRADALGNRLQLTFEDRAFLRIKTIGACDVTKVQRKRLRTLRNREQARLRAASKRAKRGAVQREQWLAANSKARTKPWQQQGISRATYYRRRKAAQSLRLVSFPIISQRSQTNQSQPRLPYHRKGLSEGRKSQGQHPSRYLHTVSRPTP